MTYLSLFNLIFVFKSSVWYLNKLLGVVPFTYVYTQLILFSFSGLQCKIITSCCRHQSSVVLSKKECNIVYSHTVLLLIIEKVIDCILLEIMSATIDFKLFHFQIGASNTAVVPLHYSSFSLSPLTFLSWSVFCKFCMKVSPLTFLSKLTYWMFMEIISATIDFNLFAFQARNALATVVHHSSFDCSTFSFVNYKYCMITV